MGVSVAAAAGAGDWKGEAWAQQIRTMAVIYVCYVRMCVLLSFFPRSYNPLKAIALRSVRMDVRVSGHLYIMYARALG